MRRLALEMCDLKVTLREFSASSAKLDCKGIDERPIVANKNVGMTNENAGMIREEILGSWLRICVGPGGNSLPSETYVTNPRQALELGKLPGQLLGTRSYGRWLLCTKNLVFVGSFRPS